MASQRGATGIMIGGRQVPFSVVLAGGFVLLFSLFTIFSSRGQIRGIPVVSDSVGASGPTVQEASTERDASHSGTVLSESGARTFLPYYMDCIHSPTFKAGSLNGACEVLHKPSNGNWKAAWDVFRQMDTLQIDASRCEAFVDVIAPEMKSKAGLKPFSVQLRPHSTDHDVFLQIYCGGDFEFIKTLAAFMPINKPLTYLDAGSNIGMASVLFSHSIMGNGQVIAVDANPETVKVMKHNVGNFPDTVLPVQAAIVDSTTAAEKDHLTFKGESNQYWGFRVDHDGSKVADTVTFDVPTKSLAALQDMTAAKKFDLIKLDIEGEEKYLMEDAASREVLCQATCVFMELHERFVKGCDAAFQAFMESGCEGEQFKEVTRSGEYIVVCKSSEGWKQS
eukprot:jgi/Ulvmu1/2583/UM014_0034.1